MSKREEFIETDEIENEDINLDSVKNKLEVLKEDIEILKKLKRKQKKLCKLEEEKNKLLADMAKEEKKSRKKHK